MPGAVQVRRDSRGVFYARLYLGTGPDGRKIQPYKSFPAAKSEAEAEIMAAEWAAGATSGGRVASARLTDMLADYIDMRELNGASPNSVRQWRTFNRRYVARFLKGARADELTSLDFTRFSGALLRRGAKDGGGLSPSTVNAVHQFLRGAYKYFATVGLVGSNPLPNSVKPAPAAYEAMALCEADVAKLAAYLEGVWDFGGGMEPPERAAAFAMWLALHTGMREGEVAAARPLDVAFSRGFLHVGGTVSTYDMGRAVPPYRKEKPKSGSSRRNVSMVAGELARVAGFIEWREGVTKSQSGPIATADGSWMRPTSLNDRFKRVCRRLGIDGAATFHTLRHTHASWCLAHGVDMVTLAERLGHSSPAVTMRVYGHMMAGRDMAAAEAFAGAVGRL